MAHYEDWFKVLWNEALEACAENPELALGNGPLAGLLETMHGIAEGEEDMWVQPGTEPMLAFYPSE